MSTTYCSYSILNLFSTKSREIKVNVQIELAIVTSDSELMVMMPIETEICTGIPEI